MDNLTNLLILYYIFLFFYIFYMIIVISKNKRFDMVMLVRIMYILIYGIVPIITINNIINNGIGRKTASLDLSENGIDHLLISSILSFIGFLALELGFNVKKEFKLKNKNDNENIHDDSLIRAAHVMLVISIFSLFVWTYPFGGPIQMFKYGSIIRSGKEISNIKNSFGFFKQFVPLAQFSSIIYLALLMKNKKKFLCLPFGISFVTSIVYLIANDGRAPFLMYIVSILVLYTRLKNKKTNKSKIKLSLSYIFIAIIGFLFISNIYSIISFITGIEAIETTTSTSSLKNFLFEEFSWTVRNGQAIHLAIENGQIYRFFLEILSALFAWLPSMFRPSWLPRLEKINTIYWHNGLTIYGGKPPDLITTSIYVFGYLGIIILPFIFGYVVKVFNNYFAKEKNNIYSDIIFVQLIYQLIKVVAYADFAIISLNFFYLFIGHLIVKFFNRKRKKYNVMKVPKYDS